MKIALATPATVGSRNGNRTTAERWRRLLRELGHTVEIVDPSADPEADFLIAIHARKCHAVIERFTRSAPGAPIIVVAAGTDLSQDLVTPGSTQAEVKSSFAWATRIVTLHPLAAAEVPEGARDRVRVILQSAKPLASPPAKTMRTMDFAVVGHLRPVKDPFLPARALPFVPARSRIRIVHYGKALDESMLHEAREHAESDRRYRWVGEQSRGDVRQGIARAHALIHPSIAEGGANTVGEAFVLGTPVLVSAVPGNLGLVGSDYPGVFPVGDAEALAEQMVRFESDPSFRQELERRTEDLAHAHAESAEREAWEALLAEIGE